MDETTYKIWMMKFFHPEVCTVIIKYLEIQGNVDNNSLVAKLKGISEWSGKKILELCFNI